MGISSSEIFCDWDPCHEDSRSLSSKWLLTNRNASRTTWEKTEVTAVYFIVSDNRWSKMCPQMKLLAKLWSIHSLQNCNGTYAAFAFQSWLSDGINVTALKIQIQDREYTSSFQNVVTTFQRFLYNLSKVFFFYVRSYSNILTFQLTNESDYFWSPILSDRKTWTQKILFSSRMTTHFSMSSRIRILCWRVVKTLVITSDTL